MITTHQHINVAEKLANATLDDAVEYLQWLVYVQDIVTLDTTIESAIQILNLHCNNTPEQHKEEIGYHGNFPRIRQLFDIAQANGLRWPKINVGSKLTIQLQVNAKGQINITNGQPYGAPLNVWYGRIERATGKWQLNRTLLKSDVLQLEQTLGAFEESPPLFAKMYGKQTGNCMFCALQLTDSRSVAQGYGPICAKNYGLPWGKNHADQIEMQIDTRGME